MSLLVTYQLGECYEQNKNWSVACVLSLGK
jgi:hypothetical protein